MDDIAAEIVEEAIAGDERFALINLGIAIENEISQSESLKIILKESLEEALDATRKLVSASAYDAENIRNLQNIIHRAASMRRWLLDRVKRAAQIEQTMHDEEAAGTDRGN